MADTNHLRQQSIDDEEIPAIVRKFLAAGATLEDIRLNARGLWMHQDEPFINKKLSKLFHRSLHQTSNGTWYLHIQPYTYPVTVELTDRFIDRLQDRTVQTQAHFIGDDHHHMTPVDLHTLYTDGDEIIAFEHAGVPTRIVGQAYRDLLEQLDEEQEHFVCHFDDETVALRPLPPTFFTRT